MKSLLKFVPSVLALACALVFATSSRADCNVYYSGPVTCQAPRVVAVVPVAVVQTYNQARTVYAAARVVGCAPVYGQGCYQQNPRPQSVYGFFDQYRAPSYRIDSGRPRCR